MKRGKEELDNLRDKDVYSLMLFALFKLRDIPEFSALSELAYVLDRENLLKLCEYFGGTTIRIPEIDELGSILCSLVLYQQVNIEGVPYEDAVKLLGKSGYELRKVKTDYLRLAAILQDCSFVSRC